MMIDPALTDPASFWDRMYDGDTFRYGTQPNAFMAASLPSRVKSGQRVLCVGDGEGRNGVWCAQQGYKVTSVEPSVAGAQKIAKLAERQGVTLEIVRDSMPSPGIADETYDAVILCYVHTPPDARGPLHEACIRALRPGGVIVLEGFSTAQLDNERTSGGPKKCDMLFTPDALRDDFRMLDIESIDALTVELDEGHGHSGPADVIRLIGYRPR